MQFLMRAACRLVCAIRDEQDSPALTMARDAAQRGRATIVELDRLSPQELRGVAGAVLDADPADVPAEAVDLLQGAARAIPSWPKRYSRVMVEDEILLGDGTDWSLAEDADSVPSLGLARPLARRIATLRPRTRELLAAATFGARFPLDVVERVTGLNDHVVLSLLHDRADHLVVPDEQTAGWYAFHHQLSQDAVLAQLDQGEQTVLACRVADVVEALHPGLPDE